MKSAEKVVSDGNAKYDLFSGGDGGIRITKISLFSVNYVKNRPFWYAKPPLMASVSPTFPFYLTTIVVKTVVIQILRFLLFHYPRPNLLGSDSLYDTLFGQFFHQQLYGSARNVHYRGQFRLCYGWVFAQ